MKRAVLTIFALMILGAPSIVSAQIDQRCFTRSECTEARSGLANLGYTVEDPEDGFYDGTDAKDACNGGQLLNQSGEPEEAGFCLPAGGAQTEVSFGGKNNFGNVAEFIQFMYRYSMSAAVILALLLIIVAGVQWMFAGGDATRLAGAKKRIGGALMGLILLSTSYVILNTINPALVNLRLPQIWLIKSQKVFALACSDLDAGARLALTTDDAGQTREFADLENADFSDLPSTAPCGGDYYIARGGGQSCTGTFCAEPDKVCVPFTIQDGTLVDEPSCQDDRFVVSLSLGFGSAIYNQITNSIPGAGFFADSLETDWLDKGKFFLYPVCSVQQEYTFNQCDPVRAAVNENFTYIGREIAFNDRGMEVHRVAGENPGDAVRYYISHDWNAIKGALGTTACSGITLTPKPGEPTLYRRQDDTHGLSNTSVEGFLLMYHLEKDDSVKEPRLYIRPRTAEASGLVNAYTGSVQEIIGSTSQDLSYFSNQHCGSNSDFMHVAYKHNPGNFTYFDLDTIDQNGLVVNAELDFPSLSNALGDFKDVEIVGNYYMHMSRNDWWIAVADDINSDTLSDIRNEDRCNVIGAAGTIDYLFYCWGKEDCFTADNGTCQSGFSHRDAVGLGTKNFLTCASDRLLWGAKIYDRPANEYNPAGLEACEGRGPEPEVEDTTQRAGEVTTPSGQTVFE